MKNKKESFLKGVFVLLLSQIFIKMIGLVYKLYLTNKEGFGDNGNAIYSSGFQIYALLLTFSSTGVPNAISKLVSERIAIGDNKGANKIFKIAFFTFALFGAIGSVLLFFGAGIISEKFIQIPEAKLSLIALSPSIFFVSCVAVIRGYFNGIQSFSETAKSQSLEQIFKTVFTIVLVELIVFIGKNSIVKMAAVANLATTIATIMSFIYIYGCYRSKIKKIKEEILKTKNHTQTRIRKTIKEILTVAFPISASSLIASFNKNIDSFTIVRFLKNNIEEHEAKKQYGILSGKVDTLCNLAFSLNIAFVTILVPNISKSVALKDYDEVSRKSNFFILLSILVSFPLFAIMFVFAKEILTFLFPNASEGAEILRLNSIAIVFMIMAQTVNAILQAIGKVNIPAISFGIGMIFKLVLNVTLIPIKQIGIIGAIIGNIICNLVALTIGLVILKKNVNIEIEIKKFILKPIFCSGLMCVCSYFLYNKLKCIKLGNMAIILALGIGCIIYILGIICLKIFSKEELKFLKQNKN